MNKCTICAIRLRCVEWYTYQSVKKVVFSQWRDLNVFSQRSSIRKEQEIIVNLGDWQIPLFQGQLSNLNVSSLFPIQMFFVQISVWIRIRNRLIPYRKCVERLIGLGWNWIGTIFLTLQSVRRSTMHRHSFDQQIIDIVSLDSGAWDSTLAWLVGCPKQSDLNRWYRTQRLIDHATSKGPQSRSWRRWGEEKIWVIFTRECTECEYLLSIDRRNENEQIGYLFLPSFTVGWVRPISFQNDEIRNTIRLSSTKRIPWNVRRSVDKCNCLDQPCMDNIRDISRDSFDATRWRGWFPPEFELWRREM